jgi:hypothetical protein
MFNAKILNGFNMARMGRFDVEHNPEDDRMIVYVKTDDGPVIRVYINADGSTSSENVDSSMYDESPLNGEPNSDEVVVDATA